MSGGKDKDMEKTFWYKDAVIYQIGQAAGCIFRKNFGVICAG